MKNYKSYLVVALLCFCMFSAEAAHVLGGEITWEHVSGDSYKVKVTVYRDCNGISIGPSPMVVTNLSTGDTTNLNLSGPTVTEITPVCKSSCTRCTDPACTSFIYGIQRMVYYTTVQLKKSESCEWLLSWTQCCKNGGVIGGTGTSNRPIYFESWMDLCATEAPNSSPQFTKNAQVFFCKGLPVTYNPGAADFDSVSGGDRLSYKFVPVLVAHGKAASYETGLSYKSPIKYSGYPNNNASWSSGHMGFHIDTAAGDIRFKPTDVGFSEMAFLVEEYRRDSTGTLKKIGSVQRTIDMWVFDCGTAGNVPSLSTLNDQADYTFCAGAEGVVTIVSSSKDINDTLSLEWNEQIDGAAFNSTGQRLPKGTFKWTPSLKDIRDEPYHFIVSAFTNDCPYPYTADMSICIKVVGSVNKVKFKIDTLQGLRNYEFTPLTADTSLRFLWEFGDGDTSTDRSPVHVYPADDNYKVTLTTIYTEGCVVFTNDTLVVKQCINNIKPSFAPLTGGNTYYICANSTFCLQLSATDPDSLRDSVHIGWDTSVNAQLEVNSMQGKSLAEFCWTPDTSQIMTESYKIRFYASDNFAPCFDKDYTELILYVQPPVAANFKETKYFNNPLSYFFNPDNPGYSSYHWDFGDGNTSSLVKPSHTYSVNGFYKVTLTVNDGPGCEAVSSRGIKVKTCSTNNVPVIIAEAIDYTICAGDSVCIEMSGADGDTLESVTLSWNNGIPNGSFNSLGEKGSFCWKTNITDGRVSPYSFTVTAKDSCQGFDTDTFYITVLPEPNSAFTALLINGREYKFIPADTALVAYSWDFGDGNTSTDKIPVHTYSADGNYFITLDVLDSSGCEGSYSASQTVFITSFNEPEEGRGWKIYPNPVKNNKLVVEFTGELHTKVSIELFDLSGKQVYGVETRQNKTEIELPQELQPGSYMLRIIGKDNYSTELLLK